MKKGYQPTEKIKTQPPNQDSAVTPPKSASINDNAMADIVKVILGIIDTLADDAPEYFEEKAKRLKERLSHNAAASVLIFAMGGKFDEEQDRLELLELEHLAGLIRARKDLKEHMIGKAAQEGRNADILRAMGIY